MNILFLDWHCFGRTDLLDYFNQRHDSVTLFSHPDYDRRESPAFMESVHQIFLQNDFDFCFSYNFFPLMATACHEHHIKYSLYAGCRKSQENFCNFQRKSGRFCGPSETLPVWLGFYWKIHRKSMDFSRQTQ